MSVSEFSVEDVRQQLTKLGYENVPDAVLEKFMARMKAQQQQQQQQSAAATPSVPYATSAYGAGLPPPPVLPSHPAHQKPYAPASLPPPVPYVSPFSNLPVSSPYYSSLSQPAVPHVTPSNVPGLPLSLRTNPAFTAQQAAYLPAPQFAASYAPMTAPPVPASSGSAAAHASASSKKDEDAYFARKEKEIAALEERLKKHAAVAHGVKSVVSTSHATAAATSQTAAPVQSTKENPPEPANAVASRSPSRTTSTARGFGQDRSSHTNLPRPGSAAKEMIKRVNTDLSSARRASAAAAAERELLNRTGSSTSRDLHRSSSHRALLSAPHQPKSILRPSTAQPRAGNRSASQVREERAERQREKHEQGDADAANVLEVVDIDTQRSLRKTYANSVKKFQRENPRYGAGGYRKSDPVTRYHAFKSKWDQSHFLNKKTSQIGAH